MAMCWPGLPGPQGHSERCDKGVAGPQVTIHFGSPERINRVLDGGLDELMPELIASMQQALAEGQIRGYGGVTLSLPMLRGPEGYGDPNALSQIEPLSDEALDELLRGNSESMLQEIWEEYPDECRKALGQRSSL